MKFSDQKPMYGRVVWVSRQRGSMGTSLTIAKLLRVEGDMGGLWCPFDQILGKALDFDEWFPVMRPDWAKGLVRRLKRLTLALAQLHKNHEATLYRKRTLEALHSQQLAHRPMAPQVGTITEVPDYVVEAPRLGGMK